MARYHHHEQVKVAEQIVDVESYVRAGIAFTNGEKFRTTDQSTWGNLFGLLILRVRLLEALEGCIKGHQELLGLGYLHRDISLANLMINTQNDPERKSFLIDLDVAIRYPSPNDQARATRTGTKVFMSINLLAGKDAHNFVDDLESFFWVLIWICIHYPKHQRTTPNLTDWNQTPMETLLQIKRGFLAHPRDLTAKFTPLYKQSKALITCVLLFAEIMAGPSVRKIRFCIALSSNIAHFQTGSTRDGRRTIIETTINDPVTFLLLTSCVRAISHIAGEMIDFPTGVLLFLL
ncbi:hypothetical protein Pst134EA_032857 [Puccinia striiformis f. sp. tritici]|uniref:uncharacterized protein n=1 Tax=Puccinia striiformis f. sp. tritici TaxID=168172 RepID=UPI00200775E3|nr:uncharacterized protein Pst134EA_032857 [Puccinia striiformis f. sp. tritici]KAH9443503.1 hypothetical protein Pst134EA_032857 [Puccinia striiformis f. sp. tritici]